MGTLVFYDQAISLDNNPSVRCEPQQVDVLDNHSVPEIRIGPIGAAHEGATATFNDWQQFTEFVDAVNDLKFRLHRLHE